jgi:hypothetical protein
VGQPGPGAAVRRRPHDSWPPLIVAATTPTWITWRDISLTILMWVLFAIMLETEFELFFGKYLEQFGLGEFHTEAHWSEFFERLKPFIRTTVILVGGLVVAALITLRRRKLTLRLPQPPALALAADAQRAGVDKVVLLAARDFPIAVVHFEANGVHRIERGEPPATAGPTAGP